MLIRVTMAAVVMAVVVSSAIAGVHTFIPSDPDMGDLDHGKYYKWGINWSTPVGEDIVSARLTFTNIYNWAWERNVLFVNLLQIGRAHV